MLLSQVLRELQEIKEDIGDVPVNIGPQTNLKIDRGIDRIYITRDWENFLCVIVED